LLNKLSFYYYFAHDNGAKYYDQRVCMSVYLFVCLLLRLH